MTPAEEYAQVDGFVYGLLRREGFKPLPLGGPRADGVRVVQGRVIVRGGSRGWVVTEAARIREVLDESGLTGIRVEED